MSIRGALFFVRIDHEKGDNDQQHKKKPPKAEDASSHRRMTCFKYIKFRNFWRITREIAHEFATASLGTSLHPNRLNAGQVLFCNSIKTEVKSPNN